MTVSAYLSSADLDRLIADQSVKAQLDMVEKLTDQYAADSEGALSAEEAAIANDIFRLLMVRAEVTVRAMMSMQLSQTDKLPQDIARKMASDVNEVAIPVLQNSTALSDEDLTGIINSMMDIEKLQAIARRSKVSQNVSAALADTGLEPVVCTLMGNESANIAEQTFEKIARRHGESAQVVEAIIQRNSVPIAIVDKVIDSLTATMRTTLEKQYGNLNEYKEVKKALVRSLELTHLKMMGFKTSDQGLMKLIHSLDENGRLSPFSALSMGNLELFEISLSRLLRVPLLNTRKLLSDAEGFNTAYARAALPPELYEAVALAVRAIRLLEQESIQKTGYKSTYSGAKVMECMHQISRGKPAGGMDQLAAMMKHFGE